MKFIEKAKNIFPNYDYSRVNYIDCETKVEIICPIHGNFLISPHSLLRGKGCQLCSKEAARKKIAKTNMQFINEAKSIFPNYDYSLVNYINNKTKVKIICSKHGEFEISPNNLLAGHGCFLCSKEKEGPNKKSNIQFINEAKNIFPNYDYSKVNYANNKEKVEVICPVHGSFFIRPYDLLAGHGCAACVGLKKLTTEEFIEKAKSKFQDYDYSKTKYINSSTKIEIICPIHGSFFIKPYDFLNGNGCKLCNKEKRRAEEEKKFINKANLIHNNFYEYGKYINNETKMEIICPKHGMFLQSPKAHLSGNGCPKCGIEKRAKNRITNRGIITLDKLKQMYPSYNFSNSKYIKATENIKFICPIHGEQEMTPNEMLNGHGCIACGNEAKNADRKLDIEEIKKRSIEYHGDVWDFSDAKYENIYTRIKVKCKFCGKYNYKKPYRIIYGKCDFCLESSGERAVRIYLEEHNIRYIPEFIFEDCRNINPLPFDFYLPELNTVIEYQGEQHFIQNRFFENLENRKKKDEIKRNYCKEHNIKEIEVRFDENVETVLNSKLI